MSMVKYMVIIVGFLVVIGLLFFLPLPLSVNYQRRGIDDQMKVNLELGYLGKIPLFKSSLEDSPSMNKNSSLIWKVFFPNLSSPKTLVFPDKANNILDKKVGQRKKRMKLDFLNWKLIIGNKDPAFTGFVVGLLWAMQSFLLKMLQTKVDLKKIPEGKIEGDFGKTKLEIEMNCGMSLPLWKIIGTSFKLGIWKIKQ